MTETLDLRCSTLTRELGEKPAGTAGCWHRVILVELPLPWPDTIEDHPLLAGRDTRSPEGRSHRILALASALTPAAATPDDGFRIICYWRPVGAPFARFTRAEVCAPEDGIAELVEHLIQAEDRVLADLPADGFADGPPETDGPVRDLLVCTHGTRDRCCGRLGTDLFRSLEPRMPAGVRLWRTSHTGGHRFAPTGLTFPDGGTWAGLDDAFALGLLDRSIPAAEAAARSRGNAGVPEGPAQVADAAGLAGSGWPWLDQERRFTVTLDGDEATVLIETPDGPHRALARSAGEVPVPNCGNPLDAARKSTVKWDLVAYGREP